MKINKSIVSSAREYLVEIGLVPNVNALTSSQVIDAIDSLYVGGLENFILDQANQLATA